MTIKVPFLLVACIFFCLQCARTRSIEQQPAAVEPRVEIRPISEIAIKKLALAEIQKNNPGKSLYYFSLALKQHPEQTDDIAGIAYDYRNRFYQAGFAALENDAVTDAKKYFDFLILLYPDWVEAYPPATRANWKYYASPLYRTTVKLPGAAESVPLRIIDSLAHRTDLFRDPEIFEYYHTLTFFTGLYDIEVVETLAALFQQAEAYDKAEFILSTAYKNGIYNFTTLSQMARIFLRNYQYQKALSFFRRLLKDYHQQLHPPDYRLIGKTAIYAEAYQMAVDIFKQMVKQKPRDVTAWRYLGKAYTQIGDSVSAFRCSEKIKEINSSSY